MTVDVAVRAANAELTAGRGPPGHRSRQRPRGGPLPGATVLRRAPRASRWAPPPGAGPTRPRSCCRCGRPRPPRPSRPTARSTPAPCASPSRPRATSSRSSAGWRSPRRPPRCPALTDAVLYLTAYPFECAEQLSSRVLAVAALKDVLAAFQAKGLPPPAELTAAVDRDVDAARPPPERRRRVPVLAPRRPVVAVRQHPRRPRAAAGEGEGVRRPASRR